MRQHNDHVNHTDISREPGDSAGFRLDMRLGGCRLLVKKLHQKGLTKMRTKI